MILESGQIAHLDAERVHAEQRLQEQSRLDARDEEVTRLNEEVTRLKSVLADQEEEEFQVELRLEKCEQLLKQAQGQVDDSGRRVKYLERLLRKNDVAFT